MRLTGKRKRKKKWKRKWKWKRKRRKKAVPLLQKKKQIIPFTFLYPRAVHPKTFIYFILYIKQNLMSPGAVSPFMLTHIQRKQSFTSGFYSLKGRGRTTDAGFLFFLVLADCRQARGGTRPEH